VSSLIFSILRTDKVQSGNFHLTIFTSKSNFID